MKIHAGLILLLFAALANAAPRSPVVFEAYPPDEVEGESSQRRLDFGSQDSGYGFVRGQDGDPSSPVYDSELNHDDAPPFYDIYPAFDNLDLDFQVNGDQMPALANDKVNSVIFWDLQQRLEEDFRRMREDMLLFRRLFGDFPSFPWRSPEDKSEVSPDAPETSDYSPFGFNPFFPNSDDDAYANDDDDFNIFGGGFRPLFPNLLPDFPGVGFAQPGDFPDNYNNETYVVHEINGTQVAVNNTINKASGDNFNSFFHHQVIHVKPGQEGEKDPDEIPEEPEVQVPEIPQKSGDGEDGINNVIPEVDNEVNSAGNFNPEVIPDAQPEASVDLFSELDGSRPESSEFNSQLSQNSRKEVVVRSLREFNPIIFPADDSNLASNSFPGPISAAYVASNSIDDEEEEEDFEEFETGDEETKAPDLSNDTRVNRVHANKEGMVMKEPDAEIFNYGLVLRESQPREDDK